LQPETAHNLSYGLTFRPLSVPNLELKLNYYDITYRQQLATPPFELNALTNPALASVVSQYPNSALQALVNAAIQDGAFYSDGTGGAFGPNPLTSAVYVFDDRLQNLSKTTTSGIDLAAHYRLSVGGNRFDTTVGATLVDKFDVEITPGSVPASEVNSVGFPARFRARAQEQWGYGGFTGSLAVNYVGSYPDTSATVARNVGSFTTFDAVARYEFAETAPSMFHHMAASLGVTNILDRAPPYVVSGAYSFPGSHYDPANADPRGRFVSATLTKRW
jgi:iron complex outermembrane recepter protein